MRLWRISDFADLSGEGGRVADGRWHRTGQRVVYLADHPALALLETIVHLEVDPEDLPVISRLLSVDVPDDVAVEALSTTRLDTEHPAWRADQRTTRELAAAWFQELRTPLLRVPSVIVPDAWNYLLNPLHSAAGRVRITADAPFAFDERLLPLRR
jgi:RES domain-containing protein